jgi:hypothetical protein
MFSEFGLSAFLSFQQLNMVKFFVAWLLPYYPVLSVSMNHGKIVCCLSTVQRRFWRSNI